MNAPPQEVDPWAGQRDAAYWYAVFARLLESGDPIPHAETARDMLAMLPVVADDAAAVTREWADLDLLDGWRMALSHARALAGGTDAEVQAPPPPGMRPRGGALDAVIEGIADDWRGVFSRVGLPVGLGLVLGAGVMLALLLRGR